jgi:integrase
LGKYVKNSNNFNGDIRSMVDDKNILVKTFKKYLELNYSNEKTRELYFKESKHFLNRVEKLSGKEPTKFTQEILDGYVIFLNSKRNPNPFYKGFVMAFRDCFDPEDEYGKRKFAFKLAKNKSRDASTTYDEYGWLTKENVTKLIEKTSTYISLTLQLFFETGLRKMELIGLDLNNKENVIDLEKRRIKGVGKGNKEFVVHFSEQAAQRLEVWMTECQDPNRPFMIFKKKGDPYKNQDYEYWYRLKKEANALGIKLQSGDNIFPHSIRHSLGRYLRRDKDWDIAQVAKKLRHSDPKTTMRYSSATQEEIEAKEDKEVFE